jgi:hypothetical protein
MEDGKKPVSRMTLKSYKNSLENGFAKFVIM